jgi:uncharacterized protein
MNMEFNEQILEKNSNIIKSYTSSSITVLGKEYNYNIIVPPVKTIIKCDKKINNISKDFIVKQLIDSANLVIIAIDNTCWISKTPIILELNKLNIGVEIMSVSSACSSHNILLSEERNFLTFFLFE